MSMQIAKTHAYAVQYTRVDSPVAITDRTRRTERDAQTVAHALVRLDHIVATTVVKI